MQEKGRRVSFAATAHVRLFEKEEPEIDIEEKELQKTLAMFHPATKDVDLEYYKLNSKSSFDIDVQGSPQAPQVDLSAIRSKLSSPAHTPTKHALTALSSATPTLDRAIQDTKFKTPDLFNSSLSAYDGNMSVDISPIVQAKTPSKDDSLLLFKTPENVVTPGSHSTSVRNQSKTPLQTQSSPSPFPKLTPKVLSPLDDQTISPLNKENLQSSKKYRDSISQFFKNTPKTSSSLRQSVTADQDSDMSSILNEPESPFIAKAAEDIDPTPRKVHASPMVVKDVEPTPRKMHASPMIVRDVEPTPRKMHASPITKDSGRELYSPMKSKMGSSNQQDVNFENVGDSEAESMVLDTKDALKETHYDSVDLDAELETIQKTRQVGSGEKKPKVRDSIAPFFEFDESVAADESVDYQPPAVQKDQSKPKVRDSIAPFFDIDESVAADESVDYQPPAVKKDQPKAKVRDSIAPFFEFDDSVAQEQSESKYILPAQQNIRKPKIRDSIAPFFEFNDTTIQDESTTTLDMSQDLTETVKKDFFDIKPVDDRALPSMDEELDATKDISMEESIEFSIAPEMTSTPSKDNKDVLNLKGISPVSTAKDVTKSPRSTSKAVPKSPRRESPRISTRSSPAPSSPGRVKKKTKNEIPTPMRPAVTPMRRAVAQKALLQSASKSVPSKRTTRSSTPEVKKTPQSEPKKTPKMETEEPESPTQSSVRRSARKRKSVGGNLLQTLQEIQQEFGDDSFHKELDEIEIPESPFAKKFKPKEEEVKDDSIINEEPLEQMLNEEPMDSFLADDFGASANSEPITESQPESQPEPFQAIETVPDPENLMDETHLPVMDTSIVQDTPLEEHPTQESTLEDHHTEEIKSLEDFLVATGLQFAPHKDVEYVEVQTPTIDQSLAGKLERQLSLFETDCYTNGSEKLRNTIEQLQSTINGFRQDMNDNPPLLFDEFAQASTLERDEMLANLNRSLQYCLLEAKADWYPWKQLLFDQMFTKLDVHYQKLEGDYQTVAPLLERFRQVGVAAKAYLDEIVANIGYVKQEYDAKVQELAQAKVLLTQEKEERKARMSQLRAQLQQIESQTQETDFRLLEMERKSLEYSLRIDQAEKMCAELVVFDPADLASVRADYHITTMTHLWRPAELLPSKQTWIFDDAIQISFTQQGNLYFTSSRLYAPNENEMKPTILRSKRSTQNTDIIMDIGPERLSEMLRIFDKHHQHVTDVAFMKRVFHDAASFWESIKALHRDIKKAEHFTSSEIEWINIPATNKSNSLGLHTTFFSEGKRTNLDCLLAFSCVNGVPLYPYGQVQSDFKVTLGNLE